MTGCCAGHHRHPACCRFDRGLYHRSTLALVQIGELAGRAERRQSMNARFDQIVAEPAQHVGAKVAAEIRRRHQIGKHAVKIRHEEPRSPEIRVDPEFLGVCRGSK